MRLFGFEITVHSSWLIAFGVIVWALSRDAGPLGDLPMSGSQRVLVAILSGALLFGSVLVHELAHAALARRQGIPVRGISLFILGGATRLEGDPKTPLASASIAAVGPLASLVLGGLFYSAAQLQGPSPPLGAAFAYLAVANLLIAVFNAIPAYPLDGGHLFKAGVWAVCGSERQATLISATAGRVFGLGIIVFGLFAMLTAGLGGVWLVLIGWFMHEAAAAGASRAATSLALQGREAADVAARLPIVRADSTVEEARHALLASGHDALPVVLGERCVGVVSAEGLSPASPDPRATYVTAAMTRLEQLVSVPPTAPAAEAFDLLNRSDGAALPVVDEHGGFVGLITPQSVRRWLRFGRVHPAQV